MAEDDEDTASTELPVESWSEFKTSLEDAAGVDKSSLTAEEAATTRRRRDETPTPENASDSPIVVHKSKGDGPLSLNEAADSLAYSRGLKLRADLLKSGYTDEQVNAHAANVLENEQNPLREPPPVEVKLPRDYFGEADEPLTAREAADKMADWRADQERLKQEALAELTGEQAQEARPEPQPQQQPEQRQPEQPDPVQQERQRVAAERQHTEAVKQMSFAEVAGLNDLVQLSAAVKQAFPGIKTMEDAQRLSVENPVRFQKLMHADKLALHKQTQLAALTRQRQALQATQQAYEAQQRAQLRAEQDQMFEQRAVRIAPQWAQPQSKGELQQAAAKVLEGAGLSRADMENLWHRRASRRLRKFCSKLRCGKARWRRRGRSGKPRCPRFLSPARRALTWMVVRSQCGI
jgi:hypothetical protein